MKSLLMLAASILLAQSAFALQFDANVPKTVQDQMGQDLAFINQVSGSGSTPLHSQIFKSVSGAAYKQYLEARVKSVGIDDCGGGGAVACVIPMLNTSKMWLSPNYAGYDMPMMDRLHIIYHEARHTEAANGFWSHDNCPVPFLDENGQDIRGSKSGLKLEGLAACDSTALGSYGSATIFSKNISKYCTNCSDKIKMDGQMVVDEMLLRIYIPKIKQQMKDDFEK
jgi:hypothetical protein